MEDSHQRVIEEMQRQHQKEVERLTEERERVLKEETNATIAGATFNTSSRSQDHANTFHCKPLKCTLLIFCDSVKVNRKQ